MYTNVDASLLVFYSIKIMASVIIIGIPLLCYHTLKIVQHGRRECENSRMCDVTHFRLNLAKQSSFERAIIGILRQLFSRGRSPTPYVISQRTFENVILQTTINQSYRPSRRGSCTNFDGIRMFGWFLASILDRTMLDIL